MYVYTHALDCCIQSKLNGCDQYFPFDFDKRIFAHTIFGSCFAHAICWNQRRRTFHLEYGTRMEKGQSIEYNFLNLNWEKSLHKFYAPTCIHSMCSNVNFPSFPWMENGIDEMLYKLKALNILSVHSYKAYINIWHFFVETVAAHSGWWYAFTLTYTYTHPDTRWVNWKTATMENIWLFIFQWIIWRGVIAWRRARYVLWKKGLQTSQIVILNAIASIVVCACVPTTVCTKEKRNEYKAFRVSGKVNVFADKTYATFCCELRWKSIAYFR